MILVRATLAALLCAAAPAHAQSFDCAKATTIVEGLICADQRLRTLDAELGAKVKAALAADPPRRKEILAQARQWLGERDRLCVSSAGELVGAARARAIACLVAAYETRLAASGAAPQGDAAALCRTLGARYRAALVADPQAPFKTSFSAASPLEVLSKAAGSGVTIAPRQAEFDQFSRQALVDWAKSRPQPFILSDAVLAALDGLSRFQLRVEQLPGESFYAAGVIEGTAACHSSIYFSVAAGRARPAAGPASWEGEGGAGCGVSRSFGTIDGAPVAFEETHDYTPSLVSAVSVAPWRGGAFGAGCAVELTFAPRFAARAAYNDWEDHCTGEACEPLRGAALALVEAVQNHPLEARKSALARLTPAQAEEFARMEALSGSKPQAPADPADAADPSSYTDSAPILLPLLHEGRLHLAALGHFTVGWRIFADWRVSVSSHDKGALTKHSVFAIGMTKGELRDISAMSDARR